jgi:hypothetical protein
MMRSGDEQDGWGKKKERLAPGMGITQCDDLSRNEGISIVYVEIMNSRRPGTIGEGP